MAAIPVSMADFEKTADFIPPHKSRKLNDRSNYCTGYYIIPFLRYQAINTIF
jgi:hypothetical protein